MARRPLKTSTDLSIDEIFEGGEKFLAARRLRKNRPWAYDIIRVLWGTHSQLSMAQLVKQLRDLRGPVGLPTPRAFERAIQSTLNSHTSQGSRFSGKLDDDLFYSPEGKYSGTWAIRDRDRAAAWRAARGLPPP